MAMASQHHVQDVLTSTSLLAKSHNTHAQTGLPAARCDLYATNGVYAESIDARVESYLFCYDFCNICHSAADYLGMLSNSFLVEVILLLHRMLQLRRQCKQLSRECRGEWVRPVRIQYQTRRRRGSLMLYGLITQAGGLLAGVE